MTPDLMLLVCSVVLTFLQMLVAVTGANQQFGLMPLLGNRDDLPPLVGWAARAQRAHLNMLQNLPLFIALILVAHIADRVTPMALLGAQLFFWGRVAYAIIYLIGIPYARTGVWTISVIGLVLIFLQLL